MAEDFDVEAMLEAPYQKEDKYYNNGHSSQKSEREHNSSSSRKEESGHRSRDEKSSDRDRYRSRSRDRDRHKAKSYERDRSRERSRHSRERRRTQEKERTRRNLSRSPLRGPGRIVEMSTEERDLRTVFCMQLAARIKSRDLDEFFSSVGKVRDVRLITDSRTNRSKGIAYVEFVDAQSVPLAIGLTGQKLLGVPIIVQASQAEKNRLAATSIAAISTAATSTVGGGGSFVSGRTSGPMKLYVGSLHFNITEDMLKGIFEPFGKVDNVNLVLDQDTGRSKGYGFVQYRNAEDAKKALEQLNGFELAGRAMKVGHVTEKSAGGEGFSGLDSDELDRVGYDLGATGRLQLMAKLAQGTGMQIPQAATQALNFGGASGMPNLVTPPIATQCFMLSNMFDPMSETGPNWERDIRDDVIAECNTHGGALHIYVDKLSPQGNVYIKCPSIAATVASVNALHGRYFSGRVITAAYVPFANYHQLFPDSVSAVHLLLTSTQMSGGQQSYQPL